VLATFTFLPVDVGQSDITIEGLILTTPLAKVITAGSEGGSVTVSPAPTPAPTNTHTPGPSPTPTDTPTPGPPPLTPTPTFVPGTTAVVVEPASQEVPVGESFIVNVMVQNVTNLGAYEFTLLANPNVISFVSVNNGWFLGSTGRSVYCAAPIADGWVLRFGCVSYGSGRPGPSGSGQLAQIIFQAANPGEISLYLSTVALADPLGAPISAAIAGGSVTVLAPEGASAGADMRSGFLVLAAVLTGMVGLLLRPDGEGLETRGSSGKRRRRQLPAQARRGMRWMAGMTRSLWRRIIG
jgi:hypothetical protein